PTQANKRPALRAVPGRRSLPAVFPPGGRWRPDPPDRAKTSAVRKPAGPSPRRASYRDTEEAGAPSAGQRTVPSRNRPAAADRPESLPLRQVASHADCWPSWTFVERNPSPPKTPRTILRNSGRVGEDEL